MWTVYINDRPAALLDTAPQLDQAFANAINQSPQLFNHILATYGDDGITIENLLLQTLRIRFETDSWVGEPFSVTGNPAASAPVPMPAPSSCRRATPATPRCPDCPSIIARSLALSMLARGYQRGVAILRSGVRSPAGRRRWPSAPGRGGGCAARATAAPSRPAGAAAGRARAIPPAVAAVRCRPPC